MSHWIHLRQIDDQNVGIWVACLQWSFPCFSLLCHLYQILLYYLDSVHVPGNDLVRCACVVALCLFKTLQGHFLGPGCKLSDDHNCSKCIWIRNYFLRKQNQSTDQAQPRTCRIAGHECDCLLLHKAITDRISDHRVLGVRAGGKRRASWPTRT